MDSGRDRALVAPFSNRVGKEGKKGGVVMAEERVGMVIKYFAKIGVAALQIGKLCIQVLLLPLLVDRLIQNP